jgi:hypothetical protein
LKTDLKIDVIYILAKAILIITILSILLKQDENEQKEIKTIIITSNGLQPIVKKDNIFGFSQTLKIKYEKTKK